MTREKFEKFKENHNAKKWDCDLDELLKTAEKISIKYNFNEQFKKAEMNNIVNLLYKRTQM
ncbi:MAG: hypothetical protein NC205_08955 [Prevotella sp.]|nr:hypothetical protein [Alistipes senegalensis]MCM1358712.1 hypothetical protein [Prevotella sp.]